MSKWTKRGRWTLTDGKMSFDVHVLYDGSHRREKYPDGVIVSPEEANEYADQILDALNFPVSRGKIIEVVSDLMKSHDELMAGIANIVVDYKLLNECRIAGDHLINLLSEDI